MNERDNKLEQGESDYGTSEREGYKDEIGQGRGSSVTTGTTGGLGSEDDDELVRAGRTDGGNPTTSDSDDIDESDDVP